MARGEPLFVGLDRELGAAPKGLARGEWGLGELADLRAERLALALSDHDHIDQASDRRVTDHPGQVTAILERVAVELDDDVPRCDRGSLRGPPRLYP